MFKKILHTTIFLLFPVYTIFCQNLVPNGSFENHTVCYPCTTGNILRAFPWFDSYKGYSWGSSDLFHYCFPTCSPYEQQPRNNGEGIAAAVLYSYHTIGKDYREDLEVCLKSQLIQGKEYCVSFYVTLHPKWVNNADLNAIDAIEAFFSQDTLKWNLLPPFNVNPQISNYNGPIINDTINWVKISGNFIAQGGERFMTIGNFKPDSVLHILNLGPTIGGFSYYFFDDVAVYECNAPVYSANCGEDKCIPKGESITLGTNQLSEYQYKWFSNDSTLIDTTAFITVSPDSTTIYYLWVEDFKYDVTWDTVTVFVNNECEIFIPNAFIPNNDGRNDLFMVQGSNFSQIEFKIFNRWGQLVFTTNNMNEGWDGRYKSRECNGGVYFYLANITLNNGEKILKKGSVTVIR